MNGFDHDKLGKRIASGAASVTWNADVPAVLTAALERKEGQLTADGALAVTTGIFTGRSVKDKFIVADALTAERVWWDNSAAMSGAHFDALLADMLDALDGKDLQAQDLEAGADLRHQMKVRVFTETAWHALFIRNLLIRPDTK